MVGNPTARHRDVVLARVASRCHRAAHRCSTAPGSPSTCNSARTPSSSVSASGLWARLGLRLVDERLARPRRAGRRGARYECVDTTGLVDGDEPVLVRAHADRLEQRHGRRHVADELAVRVARPRRSRWRPRCARARRRPRRRPAPQPRRRAPTVRRRSSASPATRLPSLVVTPPTFGRDQLDRRARSPAPPASSALSIFASLPSVTRIPTLRPSIESGGFRRMLSAGDWAGR